MPEYWLYKGIKVDLIILNEENPLIISLYFKILEKSYERGGYKGGIF